jgi:hypothetical protein
MKLKAQSSKFKTSSKSQAGKIDGAVGCVNLELGFWIFSGALNFELGNLSRC